MVSTNKKNTNRSQGGKGQSNPCCDKQKTNHPDWYTREGIEEVLPQFLTFASVKPTPGVADGGLTTLGIVRHRTVIHPPVDRAGAFMTKVHEMYDYLVKKNTAAASLTPGMLAAYVANYYTGTALLRHAERVLQVPNTASPLYRESPYAFGALCGVQNYNAMAQELGNYRNRYNLEALKWETLPMPRMPWFDRVAFMYGSIFADDAKTDRPALISFVPSRAFKYSVGENDQLVATPFTVDITQTGTVAFIDMISDLYDFIQADENFDRLKGLIMKSFGDENVFVYSYTNYDNKRLSLVYDEPVARQLANASMLGYVDGSGSTPEIIAAGDVLTLTLPLSGVVDQSYRWNGYDGKYLVSGVQGKDSKYLRSITRMMNVAKIENGATRSTWIVSEATGDTIWYSEVLTDVTATNVTSAPLQLLISQLQGGSISASNLAMLWWLSRNMACFPAIFVSENAPHALVADISNFGVISEQDLITLTEISNRSLLTFSLQGTQ